MKVLSRGTVMEGGRAAFEVVAAQDDEARLVLTFVGPLHLHYRDPSLRIFLDELGRILAKCSFASIRMDFTQMPFCNDAGVYALMDILDAVYESVPGPVTVRRIAGDDWQVDALRVLLNLDETANAARTTFEDVERA
ncbi:hypothetical protein [Polyangium jinanense]|uniref:STAS domain-containing protein n=1 Tax=Polyangium jinanense TaxID=2829994 RepID=A0A9X3X9N0_9BACT|nr:hypothetical protein [Polyangium jinanense]MDC3959828.1 hypothetical protein [Polyangium jinanense]MDC3986279.1 hypothetical protein [Polyangium jinanense]